MSLKETVLKKSYSSYFILFILGLSYYSLYFLPVFLNLNNVLCNSIDDNLKNYFTFAYQVKHCKELLHFNGFNYPFGEHVVYTDCQPLLTFILHPLGFTHDYSIGILHFLMFFSILICPLVYLHIFKQIGIPKTAAFTAALAITILSPQLYRIYIGHYALAYACLIPLSAAGILNYLNNPQNKKLGLLFLFNCIIFLVHPYYGLGLSLFTFLSLCFYIPFHKKKYFLQLLNAILTGILPIILFRVFMHATDTHVGRSPDPLGNSDFISNMSSLLVPIYGPFNKFMEKLVGEGPPHFEGIAYLGVGLMILTCICILILPFYIKKIKFNKPVLCLFFASLFFLLFSFGFQYRLQEIFGIKLQALNQFRAMGRFSWFLYYVLPILIFSILVELAKQFKLKKSSYLLIGLSFVYLIFNLIEGDAYFKIRESEYWKDRNVFNPKTLTLEEKNLINRLNQGNTQGIIPLPTYYLGNEVYDRSSFTLPLFTSAIYSYHTGLPIVSACMSRTSVNETEYAIDLLNSYKRKRITDSLLNTKLFFVIKTREPLLEDEKRLWRVTKFYSKNDTTEFGFVSPKKIQQPILDFKILEIKNQTTYFSDTAGVIYIQHEARPPFLETNQLNYDFVYVLDSNKLKTGTYIISLHYQSEEKNFTGMANSLIVTRAHEKEYVWQDVFHLKLPSGFVDNFSIVEYVVQLEHNCKYEFMIHGSNDAKYRVSNFLLRPYELSTRVIHQNLDTLYNNFPR